MCRTTGAACETSSLQTSIPPSSFHTIRVKCRPLTSGILVISGCAVQIPGCTERDFIVPARVDEATKKRQRPSTSIRAERVKTSGLRAWQKDIMTQPEDKKNAMDEVVLTECRVIPQQPLVQVKGDNLSQASLMLYEGERCVARRTRPI